MKRRREPLRSQRFHRSGLSRLDVVMILLAGLVMLALLAPAQLASWTPARRTICKDNLHQMGIALHNYHEQYERFPPGAGLPWDFKKKRPLPTNDPKQRYRRDGTGWLAYLLPFMDLPTLAEKIDPWVHNDELKALAAENHPAEYQVCRPVGDGNGSNAQPDDALVPFAAKQIPFYLCPSAEAPEKTAWSFGTACYAGNFGSDQNSRNGFFSLEGHFTKFDDITDGATYTIAVGEAGGRAYPFEPFEPADTFQPQWIGSPHGDRRAVLRLVRHDRLPNTNHESFNCAHQGGVHVLAADGAVHFIGNRVHPAVWVSLGTIRRLES